MGFFPAIFTSTYRHYLSVVRNRGEDKGRGLHIQLNFNNPKLATSLDFSNTQKRYTDEELKALGAVS